MGRDSYPATIIDWRQLLGLLDEEMARSPAMERQVALLAKLLVRAQEIVNERSSLQASVYTLTRELQDVLRTGRIAANYLRTAVKVQIPSGSPRLKKFGINTGGRPRGSRKSPAPRK